MASAIVVLLAGFAKASDTMAFVGALDTWTLVPKNLQLPLAFVIPSVEVGVASLVVLGVGRRMATLMLLVLVGAFTVAYATELATGKPPDCGCFGALRAFASEQWTVRLVLLRNGILLVGLASSWWNLKLRRSE